MEIRILVASGNGVEIEWKGAQRYFWGFGNSWYLDWDWDCIDVCNLQNS